MTIPTWAVFLIVLLLVLIYWYTTSRSRSRNRQRDRAAAEFAKLSGFYANQVFVDVRGEVAVGIDDRGRRIAVSRRRAQPRLRVYSFAQLLEAEVLQDGTSIARVAASADLRAADLARDSGEGPESGPTSLFGATALRPTVSSQVVPRPVPLSTLAVRISFADPETPPVVLYFLQGRAVDVGSVAADRAFEQARTCLAALRTAMLRGAAHGPRRHDE